MQASLVRSDVTDVTLSEGSLILLTSLKPPIRAVSVRVVLLNPERAIEGPILDRFANVLGCDIGLAVEIGDCARDFQNTIISARAEV